MQEDRKDDRRKKKEKKVKKRRMKTEQKKKMKTEGRRRRRRGKKTSNPSRHAAPTNMSVSSGNSTVTRTPSNRTPSGRVGPGDSEGGADKSAGQHHRHCDTTTAGNRRMIYLSASTAVVLQ